MTLVIGMLGTHEECSFIAGDAYCTSDEDIVETCVEHKVHQIRPGLWLGAAGLVSDERAVIKALKDVTEVLEDKEYGPEWVTTELSDLIKESLEGSNTTLSSESAYFLATPRNLYYLDSDMSIWQADQPYVAIGMGRIMALPTMAYIVNSGLPVSTDVLERVIKACEVHSPWIKGPVHTIKVFKPKQ